ncbi:hypothetical protein [Streptomyces lunalinharesii]|uniref:hypothetical protein n=1 Tax=Streptomyces lunalinharesii TaxID=333384 RepID=UPI0031D8EA89
MDEESADALAVLAATSMVSVGVDTADYRELRLLVAPDASPPEDPAQAERWWLEVLRGELKRDPGLAAHLRSFLGVAPAPPVAGSVRNSLAGGTAHGPVVQAGTIGTLTLHAPSPSGALPDPGGWPTVGQLEPVAFGVRPAHRVRKHPLLPRYVLRDRDGDLGMALAQARSSGGLVLVLGEPFAGKSRAALAALGRGPAGLRVFAPAGGTDLRGLPALLQGRPERHVIWLDDLDEHLGDGGLEPRLLAQLTALRVVVLATMREDAYDACRAEPRGRTLDLAHVIELAREWSPAERERLAREAGRKGDPRLAGAASASGPEGVAAYLALSPLLWDEWRRARRADRHPRGHALVRAALDLARCGLTGPLPMDLLLKVHEGYADVTGREREPTEDALGWASRPRHGLLPLLTRATEDTWRAAPLLVEAAARHEELPDVPGPVWACALETARTDPAYDYAEIAAKARDAFRRAADGGDASALHDLGLLAESLGEGEEAECWFWRAAEAGEAQSAGRIGRILAERGEGRQAEPFLETAADAGDAQAATLLGKLLRKRAERWLEVGMDGGSGEAAHLLGDLWLGSHGAEAANQCYVLAADAQYAPVAASIASVYRIWNEAELAEVWLCRAADAGDNQAAEELKGNLSAPEALDGQMTFLLIEAEAGGGLQATNLGVLLERRDRPGEARPWYLKGYEQGDAYGAFRLAELHKKDGDEAEAMTWYRKAAAMGHPGAQRALGESDA